MVEVYECTLPSNPGCDQGILTGIDILEHGHGLTQIPNDIVLTTRLDAISKTIIVNSSRDQGNQKR